MLLEGLLVATSFLTAKIRGTDKAELILLCLMSSVIQDEKLQKS